LFFATLSVVYTLYLVGSSQPIFASISSFLLIPLTPFFASFAPLANNYCEVCRAKYGRGKGRSLVLLMSFINWLFGSLICRFKSWMFTAPLGVSPSD
jgi:hypothetical protein